MFENISADFRRLNEAGFSFRGLVRGLLSQGMQAILVYRFFRWLALKNVPSQPLRFFCERTIEIVTGVSIPVQCKIGAGVRIHHFGGIILHPSVEIGRNSTLYHEVTIGDRGGFGGAAKIGHNVFIGAGAKIIGEINVGNNCTIGANTVVTKDLPDDSIAIGNPCQIKKKEIKYQKKEDNSPIRIMDFRGTYKGGGGPDKTILFSADQHNDKRVNVLVTYLRDPKDKEFDIHIKASRLNVQYTDVFDCRFLDVTCLVKLSRLIKEHKITLLHSHDDKTLLYGVILKFFNPGLKIMYTCHSHSTYKRDSFTGTVSYYKYLIREKTQIFLMKQFSKPILTISENTRQRLISNGISSSDIEVLYNGIDPEVWRKEKGNAVLKEKLAIPGDGYLVGTVARITYDKDLSTFYKTAEMVGKQIKNVTFVIVGDGHGEELANAKRDVEQLGLSHLIIFTGHRNDLLNIYSSFDIFLLTSLTEGLPNTVLEAMAIQVPVVSTAVGGVPELVIHGQTGFLASKGDVNGLAQHVITLLENDSQRKKFAAASKERILDSFSFSERVKKMEDYYELFSKVKIGT